MGNMSYCRFENTLTDLEDCLDHIGDELSDTEEQARQRMIEVCRQIFEEDDE